MLSSIVVPVARLPDQPGSRGSRARRLGRVRRGMAPVGVYAGPLRAHHACLQSTDAGAQRKRERHCLPPARLEHDLDLPRW